MTNFEVRQYDAAGRLGTLEVPRAGVTVETPTILPVVNPHVQTIDPAALESEFGAEILITNSYILHKSDELREPALEQGLHDLLDFSGAVMTDSGSFQLAEYGEITVTTEEILAFQRDIGSDVGTPVDIPTPPDVDRERAAAELSTTQTDSSAPRLSTPARCSSARPSRARRIRSSASRRVATPSRPAWTSSPWVRSSR